jgi:hypothetical protein
LISFLSFLDSGGIRLKISHGETVFHPNFEMFLGGIVSPLVGHVSNNPSMPFFEFSFLCDGSFVSFGGS